MRAVETNNPPAIDICAELAGLVDSGILTGRAAHVCLQAASLLERIQELVFTGLPETVLVERLELILAEHDDGTQFP